MPRPSVRCCDPHVRYFPSGAAWAHSLYCPKSPGQKIKVLREGTPAQTRHLRVVQDGETRSKGVVTADYRELPPMMAHPACVAAVSDGSEPCSRCAWLLDVDTEGAAYTDAHLDEGR